MKSKEPRTLYIAVSINILAILWFLIFLEYFYFGVFLGISVVTWFFIFLKKKQDELETNFQLLFSGKNIRYLDKKAVFRAQESHGYTRTQGKGYLVLTDDELYFEMVLLNKAVLIPVVSILSVGQTKRIKGVGHHSEMLKVEFMDHNGCSDSIALSVKELESWKKAIESVMNEHA